MTDQHIDLNSNIDLNSDLDFTLTPDENPISQTIAPNEEISAPISAAKTDEKQHKMSLFSRIPVTLTLEVASVEISLSELLTVHNDSVIELDKLAGEPLDIKVNGILFGQAEVVVINEKYGLRIIGFNRQSLGELTS